MAKRSVNILLFMYKNREKARIKQNKNGNLVSTIVSQMYYTFNFSHDKKTLKMHVKLNILSVQSSSESSDSA